MEKFKLYENMDEMNTKEFVKNRKWPKNKKYTVICDGVEITVKTNFTGSERIIPDYSYDAYEAMESMYKRQLRDDEIRWENNGKPQYADPEFDTDKIRRLKKPQIKKRADFIAAIANLLDNQETIEAIVKAATKKADGTLHKNRVLKVACSGLTYDWDGIFAIFAKAKSDNLLVLDFDHIRCKPGDSKLWEDDFVSTYHEGLLVSEALKTLFE